MRVIMRKSGAAPRASESILRGPKLIMEFWGIFRKRAVEFEFNSAGGTLMNNVAGFSVAALIDLTKTFRICTTTTVFGV